MRPSAIASPPVQPSSVDQVGHRLGQDDIGAELGEVVSRSGASARAPSSSRARSRARGSCRSASRRRRPARASRACARTPRRPRRARVGAGRAPVARAAPWRTPGRGRRSRTAASDSALRPPRARAGRPPPARRARAPCRPRVRPLFLTRRRRDLEHPRLAQPDVLAECAHRGEDPVAGAGELERACVAEHGAGPAEHAPVAVDEAPVAAARAVAATLRLDEHDAEVRRALLQRARGPETAVAAADDRDVRFEVARERRRRLVGRGFLEPPDGRRCVHGRDARRARVAPRCRAPTRRRRRA